MTTPARSGSVDPAPRPTTALLVAAALVAIEAVALIALAVAEALTLSQDRLVMGLSTTVFFIGYGAALLVGAWGLTRPWAVVRSPVVLAQLIQLGVAWSFRGGDTSLIAAILAAVAAAVLILVLLPSSTLVLAPDDD